MSRAGPSRHLLRGTGLFVAGALATSAIVFAARAWIDEERDRALLILLNHAGRSAWLDGFAVFLTDFSIALFAVLLTARTLALAASEAWPGAQRGAGRALIAAGPMVALGVVVALRGEYEPTLLVALALATCVGFAALGRQLTGLTPAGRARGLDLFIVTALSIAVAQIAIAAIGAGLEHRPRPLSWENASWNEVLIWVPEERVRNGPAYPSGHAASFFALLAPLWLGLGVTGLRGAAARAGLLAWALAQSWTRVYLAAHYPSDAIAGSALGLGIGMAAWLGLGRAVSWPWGALRPDSGDSPPPGD